MPKYTLSLLLLICSLALLSLVSAQDCGSPDVGGNGQSCPSGCCSSANFCGVTELHCGPGCQANFGTCGSWSSSSSSSWSSSWTSSWTSSWSSSTSSWTASATSSSFSSSATFTSTSAATPTSAVPTSVAPTTSSKTTVKLQPTDTPSGATSSQDKPVKSTLALVVVFFAGLMMI
ncbi:hypothetical protein B0O80DRAFT_446464 [Mortierella sp. GBAus27b]|nr:hypothetical protein B0O80DRAFT_446464 [Mortierella sp. GBAus27b]